MKHKYIMHRLHNNLISGQKYKFYTCIPYKDKLKTFSGIFSHVHNGLMYITDYKDDTLFIKNELWTVPYDWISDVR